METQSTSRKRRRTDADGSENPKDKSADVVEKKDVIPPSRDGTYYLADGDCVIRVKDVLFKIHRYFLARDSSVFSDMFDMPQENGPSSQAVTDENPIVLPDDVADFRALCWSIYAVPTEYMDQADESKVDIGKLVSLFLIAQKYQFESHEKFARGLLKTHGSDINKKPANIQEYFLSCSEERLKALLKIASLTDAASDLPLGSIVEKIWLFRFDINLAESMTFALNVGKTLGLRGFMGKLYYDLLNAIGSRRIEGSATYYHPVDDLTLPQRLEFFNGYWSLQRYWSDLMQAPRKKFKCPSNQPSHSCNRVWKAIWPKFRSEIAGDNLDPIANLKSCLLMVTMEGEETDCVESYINEMILELENSLADHFLGPLPTVAPAVEAE